MTKITYTSVNVDLESFHRDFDAALARVRVGMGQDPPLFIGPIRGGPTGRDRRGRRGGSERAAGLGPDLLVGPGEAAAPGGRTDS
jgi:hypothetical protein